MHFYRPLAPIAAITFDLDDTLYDNAEVIRRTETESLGFLQGLHPELNQLQAADFQRLRTALRAQEPDIYHDVTEWRRRTVEAALLNVGLSLREAEDAVQQAMAHFAEWRSKITPPQETHDTLRALAERWPLVAITNGNADPHRFGLDRYFRFILRAGPDGRAKPFSDMYHLTAQKLGLRPQQLLHVGDDLTTDVAGAVRSGLQACWINLRAGDLMHIEDARLLPHLEISRLASLTTLL